MGKEGPAVLTRSPDPISNLSAGKLGVGSAEAGESPEPGRLASSWQSLSLECCGAQQWKRDLASGLLHTQFLKASQRFQMLYPSTPDQPGGKARVKDPVEQSGQETYREGCDSQGIKGLERNQG